nr:nucleic acid-binding, OB-fold protein [Tanacetum cinerariifolium]
MAEHCAEADLKKTEQPVIIVVSFCHVSKYRDYQLAATPATYYYLNSNIPEAETSRGSLLEKRMLASLGHDQTNGVKHQSSLAQSRTGFWDAAYKDYKTKSSCHRARKSNMKRISQRPNCIPTHRSRKCSYCKSLATTQDFWGATTPCYVAKNDSYPGKVKRVQLGKDRIKAQAAMLFTSGKMTNSRCDTSWK